MPRRRGNPTWASGGQPLQPARGAATEFEVQVRLLGLTKETCAGSRELRTWCERNRNRCYIPEWLLNEVSRRELLNAELIAIDLWNKSVANNPAPSGDEKKAFDVRMTRREAILAELEELSHGN
jgi:hypothetical protein